ncbi:unnamed protein product, partial [Rotaria magnacalcarata]
HAIIKHEIPSENNNLNVSIRELFINENDLPISPKLTSFDISIFTTCDTRSIAYILRCMPNLLHFKFLHESREVAWPSAYDLVNGYTWRHLFEMNVPFLFEFYFSYLNFERISKIRFRHGRKFISIFRSKISRMPKIHVNMRTICSSSWSNSLRFVNCVQPNGNDDAQQYVAYLSNVVHFP